MNKIIYLVEDEENLNRLLKKYLELEGYAVTTFKDGESAIVKIKDCPDLWVLDIMLPDIDGYEIINKIKDYNKNTPVIFMSARNEELDRVLGLELGSEDYISKPFLPRELVIRVNKLMNLLNISKPINAQYNIGGYKINLTEKIIYEGDIQIQLTVKEFELLLYFYNNNKTVLSREQILTNVWGHDYFGSDRVVDDTIRRVRKKMNKINIETIYGYGYKLV